MRIFTRLFFLLLVLLPSIIWANVVVHGKVRYTNGSGVAGVAVHVVGDSALAVPGACYQTHVRYTDASGSYSDTLVCNVNMSQVLVWIMSCNGTIIRQNYTLTPNQNVESNFVYCDPNINQCLAAFTWQASSLETHFFSSGSVAGNPATDSISTRTWTFGDGTSFNGNTVNPVHVYAHAGTYIVCLKIRTYSGCENTYCITIHVTSLNCLAGFYGQRMGATNRFSFNSTYSSALTSDSLVHDTIISRKWRFGDGDTLTGNVVSPEHTYLQYGNYNTCLTIKTALGCEKTYCASVWLPDPLTNCHADFLYHLLPSSATGHYVQFSSFGSSVAPGDSILHCQWKYGDGTTGNDSLHNYSLPGTYTACLVMQAASGCRDSICRTIVISQSHCEAVYTIENITTPPVGSNPILHYIRFNSSNTHGSSVTDSIISRTWNFGDSIPYLGGNQINPLHGYVQSGTYNACLYILTQSGCRDTVCHTVIVAPPPVTCQPRFTTNATGLLVVINSSTTSIAAGDSIISRTWTFGDGTTASNAVVLTHQYANIGEYQICLTIRTRLGCVSTSCKRIPVINEPGNCVPYFTKEQTAAPSRTIRFNSIAAYSQLSNDSIIIERRWEFGDGQVLNGNVINPLHTYLHGGTYNVCLFIRTLHCDKRWCQPVVVRPFDSTNATDSIQIVNLYPVPVTTQLNAVIYSSHSNTAAELAIYDVYGIRKWSQSTTLPLGNSTHNIPTSQLANGPYIFKVTTVYGIKSRNFYKLN